MSLALSLPVAPVAAILDSQKPTVTFSEGASGALKCTTTGVPAPTISWFLNGVLLSDDGVSLVITSFEAQNMTTLSVTSTLNATSVTRENTFATITCTASNGVGASSDSTQLIVLCKSLSESVMRCERTQPNALCRSTGPTIAVSEVASTPTPCVLSALLMTTVHL